MRPLGQTTIRTRIADTPHLHNQFALELLLLLADEPAGLTVADVRSVMLGHWGEWTCGQGPDRKPDRRAGAPSDYLHWMIWLLAGYGFLRLDYASKRVVPTFDREPDTAGRIPKRARKKKVAV